MGKDGGRYREERDGTFCDEAAYHRGGIDALKKLGGFRDPESIQILPMTLPVQEDS